MTIMPSSPVLSAFLHPVLFGRSLPAETYLKKACPAIATEFNIELSL